MVLPGSGKRVGDIVVSLVRGGAVVEKITRPLRWLDGKPAITYRKALWLVHDGKVYLDVDPEPASESVQDSFDSLAVSNTTTAAEPELPPLLNDGWDLSQRIVISAPSDARQVVDAGPGTGKTAVACARIATLIDSGAVEPVNCLIVSFTQTAVYELRDRIGAYLSNPVSAAGIRIVTLDAYAWSIRAGFDADVSLEGYEEGIAAARDLIASDPDAVEYLERAQHVIIDEAQDIIGVRADFVCKLIETLGPDCGVTAFADEAQAIYGFADDSAGAKLTDSVVIRPLPQRLREAGFAAATLKKVHRTASPVLHEIFTSVRSLVLDQTASPVERAENVRAEVDRLAGAKDLQAKTLRDSSLAGASLVLFRRRAEVLQASAVTQAVPHRLRLGGLPVCLQPWIAACLFDFIGQRIARDEFDSRWSERVSGVLPECGDSEGAWMRLMAVAGMPGGFVDVSALRRALARRQPPPGLSLPEFGTTGPILGTIHGSKGREADSVLLFLPTHGDGDAEIDYDEETRILFVGATRARMRLRVGRGYQMKAGNLARSRRTFSFPGGVRQGEFAVMTEIGRDGDIRASGLAGREFFDQSGAIWAQRRCLALATKPEAATATRTPSMDYAYALAVEEEQPIAVLSKAFRDDLWELAKKVTGKRDMRLQPPSHINHIRLTGLRTVVLAPEDPECERLHEPWASSGFLLAPTVIAYTKISFWKKK